MRLTFVQLAPFASDWKRMKLTDEDLQSLETSLLEHPHAGAVIAGTGGLRKLRFAPPTWHTGKRGATRVIYAYYPERAHIFMVLIYGKNEQGNLSADQKRTIRAMMDRIDAQMRGG